MRTIEHGQDFGGVFQPFTVRRLTLATGGDEIDIDLTPVQTAAVMQALGVRIDEHHVTMWDDGELKPWLDELDRDWVGVQKAANMLGVTRGRVYAIIRSGGLETHDGTGKVLVSVRSIEERLQNPPASHRPAKG